jgi:hypothetical protein
MNITVKNYKSCRGDEGDAFSCTMYVNSKKAAYVRYDGRGGCYLYHWVDGWQGQMRKRVDGYIASLPKVPTTFGGKTCMLDKNLDWVLDDIINVMLETRQLKRWCKTKTVITKPGGDDGQYITWKGLPTPALRAHIAAKYPSAEIINDRFTKNTPSR